MNSQLYMSEHIGRRERRLPAEMTLPACRLLPARLG